MSDQEKKINDIPVDELMLEQNPEEEDIEVNPSAEEDQDYDDIDPDQEVEDSTASDGEGKTERRQKFRELEFRSRLSSFSSVKSTSSVPTLKKIPKEKTPKVNRPFDPYMGRTSHTHKRDRSSNSSAGSSIHQNFKARKSNPNSGPDFDQAAGGSDKKKTPPPVRNTPAGKSKIAPVRNQPNPEATPSTSKTRSMASGGILTRDIVEDFAIIEQNSERVNINDIKQSSAVAPVILELASADGLKTIQAFISSGKRFSEAITKARSSGKKFIRAMNLIINIQTDPDQITHMDLTKQRVMALCHSILFKSGKCGDFNSPLVGRINFSPDNPLTLIRPLLGAGFQFLGQVVIDAFLKEHYKDGILLFHIGCMALDYIRKTSPSKDPRTGALRKPDLNPELYDFSNYAVSDIAGSGEVFVAGCRNLDQSTLRVLEDNANEFCRIVTTVDIGRFGGSLQDRVAKNFSSIVCFSIFV